MWLRTTSAKWSKRLTAKFDLPVRFLRAAQHASRLTPRLLSIRCARDQGYVFYGSHLLLVLLGRAGLGRAEAEVCRPRRVSVENRIARCKLAAHVPSPIGMV